MPFWVYLATVTTPDDWSSVISAMSGQVNIITIAGVLVTIVGSCIGIVFLWWGVRKAASALMTAFRKGRMSI